MKVAEFGTYLEGVKTTPKGYVACCPAHNDPHPSLVVTETDDRILIHCRAGCGTGDILAAMGLDYPDLFLDHGKSKGTTHRNGPRQPERLPRWYWDWRSQCGELERAIEAKREHHEAILVATQGMDISEESFLRGFKRNAGGKHARLQILLRRRNFRNKGQFACRLGQD